MSDETALAVKPPPIAATSRGLELRGLEDMYRFAQYVAKSGLAPKGMTTPEPILVALQMGAELGLTPMASLQNIAVINGRPSVWGDGMLAVCQGSGQFDHSAFFETVDGEGDKRTATCNVQRKGGVATTRTFSVFDAKRAGLWGKAGPWKDYPDRMLQMRARSFALRDTFADVLRGFDCSEEVRDIHAPAPVGPVVAVSRTAGLLAKLKPSESNVAPIDDAELPPVEGALFDGQL